MRKVVLAFDSYKGCLTAKEACSAAAKGLHRAAKTLGISDLDVVSFPMSDGGEGMLRTLVDATNGQLMSIEVHGAKNECRMAQYGISGDGRTAFLESANVCGLTLVPKIERNPWNTTSYGIGEIIRDALDHKCSNIVVGLGGSATNDAGMGLLQALGYKFFNKIGAEIKEPLCGRHLGEIASIDISEADVRLSEVNFSAACDVKAPLFGKYGAAYVFARQKGATDEIIQKLDDGLRNFANVVRKQFKSDMSNDDSAGAAGGLGFCMKVFLHAKIESGIDYVLDTVGFNDCIKDADLVVTGEGKSDMQTLMGKVPVGILNRSKRFNVPVFLVSGIIENYDELVLAGFNKVESINADSKLPLQIASLPDVAKSNIEETVAKLFTATIDK